MSFDLAILILHLLGAGLVIGVVLLALFAVIKPPVTRESIDRMLFISKFGVWASIWQFLTGLVMVLREWEEFRSSRIFWTKMILYVVEGALASRLIAKQAGKAATQIASGQAIQTGKLRGSLAIHAMLIVAIAVLGVILVSGGEE